MNDIKIEKADNIVIRIGKGLILSFLSTLIGLFVFSIILTYTNISERVIPVVIIVLTFISILIGSIIVIRTIRRNGLINGGIIGGTYVLLLYLVSSILNTGFTFNMYTIVMIIVGILSGIIGGVIGVNT